jgi:Ca2+-binding EF-hand superfamily protein
LRSHESLLDGDADVSRAWGIALLTIALVCASWIGVSSELILRELPSAARATSAASAVNSQATQDPGDGFTGCLHCHAGIEDMHPAAELSCVDCHGGNSSARLKLVAHVEKPKLAERGDERVPALDRHLAWRRFVNPMDMRVVKRTCGMCHADMVHDLELSLHGTTAGHLSDGFYEMGLLDKRGSKYSVFPVRAHGDEIGEVEQLVQVPAYRSGREDELASHYMDLARKECMQCHLYSPGRAVDGRIGFDGDYRGDGCAACHVTYGVDGLSDSADRSVKRNEPGHPLRHSMTRAPTTQTCTTCHYGDASIGMHFRGLSQLPPGAAGGPEIPGTTNSPLHRQFLLNDPAVVPPDVHHENGMHCIDCHTQADVMGDGKLHGQMEYQVEVSCEDCHGSFEARAKLHTERGTPLEHMFEEAGEVFLRSKVDGKVHRVKQVVNVLDPEHNDFNDEGARAMNSDHGKLECYTCHAGWNVNFLGFHFYRNEQLSQLDLLSGVRTPGRVTTQEKVFSSWKSFYAGWNEAGRVAPYLTGFSTMGTVDDSDGKRILDQVMPVTAAGLSGMTMVHHQLHSTRPTARSCVECHRSSSTWGMGSINFRLARQLAFVADRRGIEIVALNRGQLSASTPLAKIVLPDVIDIEVDCDSLQGHAQYIYATEGGRGIHVVDVRDPVRPDRVAFIESISPRGMALHGDHLLVADGIGGLKIYDVSEPEKIRRVGLLPMFDAHEVFVLWPYAYVADGPGGLAIVDIRAPIAPRLVSSMKTTPRQGGISAAIDVDVLFQYSRPMADMNGLPIDERHPARLLIAVADEDAGLILIDGTEATHPRVVYPVPNPDGRSNARNNITTRGLAIASHVDVAGPQGGERTLERDYAYVLEESQVGNQQRSFLRTIDITNPARPEARGRVQAGFSTEMIVSAAVYNQPFLQRILFTPGDQGVFCSDASVSLEPSQLGTLAGIRDAYVVALEEFPLDQMVAADGRPLKDISHPKSRWFGRGEIGRLLDVPGEVIGTITEDSELPLPPGGGARQFFKQLDRDRSGLLTGKEYSMAGGRAGDQNEDGRITLFELAQMGGAFGGRDTRAPEADEPVFLTTRVDPDGDLARLLDGVNAYDYDADNDRALNRKEMTRAFFDALDLDGDNKLTIAELSRSPGSLRQLRYGDLAALDMFEDRDRSRGGTVSVREYKLRDIDWNALDENGNGIIQLQVNPTPYERRQGIVGARSEWPTRKVAQSALPPLITADRLLAVLDSDKDGRLSNRELRKRPELFRELDRDGNGYADPDEIARRVNLVTQVGVDVTAESFEDRWDLDGDGRVRAEELPDGAAAALLRVDKRRE